MKSLQTIYNEIGIYAQSRKQYAIFKDREVSYAELIDVIDRVSGLLQESGISTGDRLLICSEDDWAVTAFTLASLMNGIAAIVLSPQTQGPRALSLIEWSELQGFVIDAGFIDQWELNSEQFVFRIQNKERIRGGSALARFGHVSRLPTWQEELPKLHNAVPSLPRTDDETALILFTSGTTSNPKGVQLSYRNLFVHLETIGRVFKYTDDSRILNNMMLSHADGLIQGPLLTAYFGAALLRPCGMEVQHLEDYLNTIYRERITHVITVPTVLGLVDRLTSNDDYFIGDHFTHLISVAGPLDPTLWARLEERFHIRLCNMYGLTETVTGGIFCGPSDELYRRDTAGLPVDMEIRIVDAEGNDLADGEQGELLMKGDNVFMGYFRNAKATEEVLRDGWLHTGDIACRDPDAFIRIKGRIKELIISGDYTIHPAELNEALLEHPAVVEAGTVGLPDPDMGEIAVSAVVLKENIRCEVNQLFQFIRSILEPKKVPRDIVIVDAIPRGESGKTIISKLKEKLSTRSRSDSDQGFSEEKLIALAADLFHLDATELSMTSHAGEVPCWDSLGHLELIVAVEKTGGISFSPREIMAIETLAELYQLIERRKTDA